MYEVEKIVRSRDINGKNGNVPSLSQNVSGVSYAHFAPVYGVNNQSYIPDVFMVSDKFSADAINEVAGFEAEDSPFYTELMDRYGRWFKLLYQKSNWKAHHSERVAKMSKEFALNLGATDKAAENIERAAKMHDIGCIWTPGEILNKNGKLTDEERDDMCRHANHGATLLVTIDARAVAKMIKGVSRGEGKEAFDCIHSADSEQLKMLAKFSSNMTKLTAGVALNHHKYEKVNHGVVDEVLNEFDASVVSEIVALCDVYDSIKSMRSYKNGEDHKTTMEIMETVNLPRGEFSDEGFELFKGFMEMRYQTHENTPQDGVRAGIEVSEFLLAEIPFDDVIINEEAEVCVNEVCQKSRV